jgi:hypothetical protein
MYINDEHVIHSVLGAHMITRLTMTAKIGMTKMKL